MTTALRMKARRATAKRLRERPARQGVIAKRLAMRPARQAQQGIDPPGPDPQGVGQAEPPVPHRGR